MTDEGGSGIEVAADPGMREVPVTPARLGKGATSLDVVRAALAAPTARLVQQDPVVRLGEDPEGVHGARVAVRRLRSNLKTLRPVLDRGWSEELREELRWLGGLLGDVRDVEVLRARFEGKIAQLAGPELSAGKVLLDDLESRRLQAHRVLLRGMRSARYAGLLERLVAGCREPRGQGGRAERPAATTGKLMARPWAKLSRSAVALGPSSSDGALHATRIDAKRVRYGAEALAPVFGKRASRFASAAEALQEVLGEHQDAVVAMSWLADRAMASDDPAVAFTAGRLAELEAVSRDRARATSPAVWRRLERGKRFWT